MTKPPPSLDGAYVIEYAIVDDDVEFEQRHTLNVGGAWIGRVPQLAICQNQCEAEFDVFHCDTKWNVLGVAAGYDSVNEAKTRVERSYHGLTSRWLPSEYSREQAENFVAEQVKPYECSFCGKSPLQYQSIAGDKVRICNHCVDGFHEVMHREFPEE